MWRVMVRKKVSNNNKIVPVTKMKSIGPDLGKQLDYMKRERIKVKNGK